MNDEIKRRVKFEFGNLTQRAMPSTGPQDIIFCKNVAIYFRPEVTRKLLKGLHDTLAPDGYLLLGHAESLWPMLNQPVYLATMELLVSLNRDPELELNTKAYVRRWSERMGQLWQGIFPEFPADHAGSRAARQVFFAALRGFVDNRLIGQWPKRNVPEGVLHALAQACAALL